MNRFPRPLSSSPAEPPTARRNSKGFSLIEVAVALGIFSFGILPVIALMGSAQTVCQESIRASARARIFEQVTPLVSTTNTTPAAKGSFYFTVDAQKTTADGTGLLAPVFTANWEDVSGSNTDAMAGLSANKVIKVSIQRYMNAALNTTPVMGTTFVVYSRDPKDLP
ncbi:MAG: prepilin-type N-terminal cleavage/methylation domain-containing protein [Verrucomicrobiota bacterium]